MWKCNLSSSLSDVDAQTKILAEEENDRMWCELLCISFRKKIQAHRDPSFLLEPVRPAGTDTFLLCQTLFWAGFLLLGISLPWLWKAKSRLFVDREWQKASYMTGGGGGFVNEKHTCIRCEEKKSMLATFTLELY